MCHCLRHHTSLALLSPSSCTRESRLSSFTWHGARLHAEILSESQGSSFPIEDGFLSGSFVGQLPTPPDDPCYRVSRNLCCWTRVHVLLSKALSPEEVVQSLCYRFTLFPQVKGNTFMCVVNIFFVKDIIAAYHEPTVSFQKHPY